MKEAWLAWPPSGAGYVCMFTSAVPEIRGQWKTLEYRAQKWHCHTTWRDILTSWCCRVRNANRCRGHASWRCLRSCTSYNSNDAVRGSNEETDFSTGSNGLTYPLGSFSSYQNLLVSCPCVSHWISISYLENSSNKNSSHTACSRILAAALSAIHMETVIVNKSLCLVVFSLGMSSQSSLSLTRLWWPCECMFTCRHTCTGLAMGQS